MATTATAAAAPSPTSRQRSSPRKLPPSPRSRKAARPSDSLTQRLLSGPLLEIVVGAEQKRWHLHLHLLRYHSNFFAAQENDQNNDELKKVANGELEPHQHEERAFRDDKLELPHDDPAAFRILVKWLYQGLIEDVTSFSDDKKWEYAYSCQNLYLLCERLSIPALKNLAIDQFRRGCHETHLVPGADEIEPVYEGTPRNSPFRKLVSRIAARQIMDPDTKRDAAMYRDLFAAQPDFAVDVLNAIREGTEGMLLDDPTDGNGCRYHEHKKGESCHKTVHFDDQRKG